MVQNRVDFVKIVLNRIRNTTNPKYVVTVSKCRFAPFDNFNNVPKFEKSLRIFTGRRERIPKFFGNFSQNY